MATYKGKDGSIEIGANVVGELRSFELTKSANEVDVSRMGDDWKRSVSTQLSWSVSGTVWWDPDDNGQDAMAIGSTVAITMFPQGDTSTLVQETGQLLITSISRPQAHDGVIEQTFEGVGVGALTVGTVA